MKQLLVLLFIFQASYAFSADTSRDAYKDENIKKTKLEDLVQKVCSKIMHAKNSQNKEIVDEVGKSIEKILLSYLDKSRSSKNYKKEIATFWNKYHESFICKQNTHYGNKHLFKVVVDMQMQTPVLLDYFLHEDNKYKINVNAYEIVEGKPETVLDYLDNIVTGNGGGLEYDIPAIKELIEIFEDEYKGLRGEELKL
jgi:hypothetical protein